MKVPVWRSTISVDHKRTFCVRVVSPISLSLVKLDDNLQSIIYGIWTQATQIKSVSTGQGRSRSNVSKLRSLENDNGCHVF